MYVLKFAASSHWPGDYVALDTYSGGYPAACNHDIFSAKIWDDPAKALDYASSFTEGGSYAFAAIEQRVYRVSVRVH